MCVLRLEGRGRVERSARAIKAPPESLLTTDYRSFSGALKLPASGPLMTLQWLQVRVKPDPCREIRPGAHRPPWDDAGAEA
jgi:hypothetical protein